MAKLNAELIINLANQQITNINKSLKEIKSDITMDFIHIINDRVIITINKLANASNLKIIEKYIKSSKNIDSNTIKSPWLPKSKSYLKIIGLPYIRERDFITPNIIKAVLKEIHIFNNIILASKSWIIKVSSKSDIAVVWVDIWDLQSRLAAKNIINWHFNVGQYITTVHNMNMNSSILQYKNCWKWEHLTLSYHFYISRCVKCNGAHNTEYHREKVWYCKENKNFNQAATKEDELCSHVFKCTNCKGDHQADSYTCLF